MKRRALVGRAALAWLAGSGGPAASQAPQAASAPPADEPPPPAPREFRGAWVATVQNIDWPSRPGLPAEVMRSEALALLERARTLGLNAIVLQVRPAGDAIYPSTLEPWCEYLAGEQGRAPWAKAEAPWDPLAFWVQEAHRRALELHAWINPYRARHSSAKSPLVAPHLGVRQPSAVRKYGDQLWMDPGDPAAVAQTLAVAADLLRRYELDGLHIDDYFYPYPLGSNGAPSGPSNPSPEQPFPDDEPWARYQLAGGLLARDDWRRANVDNLVQALQRTVRQVRPTARFGISPFGVGKPDRRPAGVSGFSQYDKLYADVERWLDSGWLDYLAPQLYWPIAREGQPFPVLLDYWLAANTQQRHVWPGLFTSKVKAPSDAWPARELLEQVSLLRQRPAAGGHIHFSLIALQQDREGLATMLQMGPYAQAALTPATPWLEAPAVAAPQLKRSGTRVAITPAPGELPRRWALWRRVGGAWRFAVLPAQERSFEIAGAERVALAGIDRIGRAGESAIITIA